MTKDPVCGMRVDEARPEATAEYHDRVFYFCSTDCRAEFESNPAVWQPAFEGACSADEVARKTRQRLTFAGGERTSRSVS